jgi:AhpD family alkylhydroperoxidase
MASQKQQNEQISQEPVDVATRAVRSTDEIRQDLIKIATATIKSCESVVAMHTKFGTEMDVAKVNEDAKEMIGHKQQLENPPSVFNQGLFGSRGASQPNSSSGEALSAPVVS